MDFLECIPGAKQWKMMMVHTRIMIQGSIWPFEWHSQKKTSFFYRYLPWYVTGMYNMCAYSTKYIYMFHTVYFKIASSGSRVRFDKKVCTQKKNLWFIGRYNFNGYFRIYAKSENTHTHKYIAFRNPNYWKNEKNKLMGDLQPRGQWDGNCPFTRT